MQQTNDTRSDEARVLHVVNGENYAGAERVQDLLCSQLPALGYWTELACVKADKFPAMRQNKEVPLHLTPMAGRFDLRPALAIAKLVRDHNFEILHSHTPRSVLLSDIASRLTGVPHVYHLHSVTKMDSTNRARNGLNAAIERYAVNRAAIVIAVSDSLVPYAVEQGLALERVAVVHNGVPTNSTTSPRMPPSTRWIIGMVAQFRPRKGLEVLLKAMAKLRGNGCNVQLRAVGEFESAAYEAKIHRLAANLQLHGHIEWRGFRRNIESELAAMDLFVLPSLFGEGLPMALLEAMGAGLPVISTRVEGIPEAVRDGVDGLLCRPGNVGDLVSAIDRFAMGEIDWEQTRLSAQARQRTHFSQLSMSRRVAEIYRNILE